MRAADICDIVAAFHVTTGVAPVLEPFDVAVPAVGDVLISFDVRVAPVCDVLPALDMVKALYGAVGVTLAVRELEEWRCLVPEIRMRSAVERVVILVY